MQCLKSQRADLLDSERIDDYVSLDWLEWRGGHLQLTVVGQNICRQHVVARISQRTEADDSLL